ncbi:hypothetical protein UA08_09482 [Talaromyces atroroseus]|uniref:Uncharacterized protein n=1 Tax=Talaromyces atroroseus TaxID=1441469 RepID=A0A1Q5Q611_TALAT|nr:hypothetical protein UA08_09482 [Talaromyces atroroseus]OKL55255.1 hypothetical protein UA08_09482 [Talaromyces atroroseus]
MRDFHHLQILHDEDVESKLHRFIPQIESWLLGTLPLPNKNETSPRDSGVVFPIVTDVDAPLAPIRALIYQGLAEFTLFRTYHATTTPSNMSKAVYTVLRVEGEPTIGGVSLGLSKSIWIDRPAVIDAGFICLISKPTEILVGKDVAV